MGRSVKGSAGVGDVRCLRNAAAVTGCSPFKMILTTVGILNCPINLK